MPHASRMYVADLELAGRVQLHAQAAYIVGADAEYAIKSCFVYVALALLVTLHVKTRIAEGKFYQLGKTIKRHEKQRGCS